MASSTQMIRERLRQLAAEGRLIDECFNVFADACYPGCPQYQRDIMRICFFAGASELWAVINAAAEDGDTETDAELEFMGQWVGELERFHEKTIATLAANENQPKN